MRLRLAFASLLATALENKVQDLLAAAESEPSMTQKARQCDGAERRCVGGGGCHGICAVYTAQFLNRVVFPGP